MKNKNKHLARFNLPNGQMAIGKLTVKNKKTLLTVLSEGKLYDIEKGSTLNGSTYGDDIITLVDCLSYGVGYTVAQGRINNYKLKIFPHYVLIGKSIFDPVESAIKELNFTTNDINYLFYGARDFGMAIDQEKSVEFIKTEINDEDFSGQIFYPMIFYYTGRQKIVELTTKFGSILFWHRPASSMADPNGFYVKNKIVVTLYFREPASFDYAMDEAINISGFCL